MSSSMLYTMGTALDRAAENGLTVTLLVEGSWLEGLVAAHDGVGVVLEGGDGQHAVVRTERIAAVRISAQSPYHAPLAAGRHTGPGQDGARVDPHAMPGQRATG